MHMYQYLHERTQTHTHTYKQIYNLIFKCNTAYGKCSLCGCLLQFNLQYFQNVCNIFIYTHEFRHILIILLLYVLPLTSQYMSSRCLWSLRFMCRLVAHVNSSLTFRTNQYLIFQTRPLSIVVKLLFRQRCCDKVKVKSLTLKRSLTKSNICELGWPINPMRLCHPPDGSTSPEYNLL